MDSKVFVEARQSLNEAQRKAVEMIEGPVMVVAGPGTGKTTILTLRIANILHTTDVQPENILALTFTNSGVHAMRKKLISIIGDTAYRVNIFTFHSFAEHIIKAFPSYFRSLEYAQVITVLEKVRMLETIMQEGDFDEIVSPYDQLGALTSVKNAIDTIKADGLTPEEFEARIPAWKEALLKEEHIYYKRKTSSYDVGDPKPAEIEKIEHRVKKAREIAIVFKRYQEMLRKHNRYDFSDIVLTVLNELAVNPNLKLDIQEQYQYIHVDEHQDTNDGQNKLIEFLTDAAHLENRPNVFTVGDEKQSIYRFQGASSETFSRFEKVFADVEVIALTENYRSTNSILHGAQSVITNTIADSTELHAHAKEDTKINVLEFDDYKYELLHVTQEIRRLIEGGVDPEEIALIYRSNKHIDEIKQLFSVEQIPYTVLSKDSVLNDPHIANLITLLRVIHDPYDNHHLAAALFIDFLGIDPLESAALLQTFRGASKRGMRTLITLMKSERSFKELAALIARLKTESENTSFGAFFKTVLEETGYLTHVLALPDSRDHLDNVHVLFDEIKRQSEQNKKYSLRDFVAFVDAMEKYGLEMETSSSLSHAGVQCMTAHKAKGLEFSHVFMVNTTHSNWEKSRGGARIALPIDNFKGDIDDERRLFYVAMTRAKKGLSISFSTHDWEGRAREPSQFISEINEAALQRIDTHRLREELDGKMSKFLEHAVPERDIFDTAYLTKLFLSQNLSVSALNNYLSCPIKYFFRNLILIPDVQAPFLIYGNAMHRALELYFGECKEHKKILSKKDLLAHFKKSIEQAPLYDHDYERYRERGKTALSQYYDRYHETWSTSLDTELYIRRRFVLGNKEEITLSGKIDKIEYLDDESGGAVRIIDYKTGKTFSEKRTKAQKEGLHRQVVFYYLLLETYKNGAYTVSEAVLDFLEKSKKGTFEQKAFTVKNSDKRKVTEEIEALARDVQEGTLLKNGCHKKDCEYCTLFLRLKV